MQDKIFRLAELKGFIILISGLNKVSGKIENYRRIESDPVMIDYDAFIDLDKGEELVDQYQAEIDTLQDELDQFNATHKITVSF